MIRKLIALRKTPVLTKFALKYETMAQKIVEHANENTLKIDNVRLVCGQTYITSHVLYIT